jgi:acyl-CoA hydrolase
MGPQMLRDAEDCVDAVISAVGREIVLGVPIALGKPNHFVNALYARAAVDRSIKLKIFTGLTFVKPSPKSELERRFLEPLLQRLLGRFPDLDYARAMMYGTLPPNIEIHEFFLEAGEFLNAPCAQQSYVSLNYTHVARKILDLGVNAVAQLVAKSGEGEGRRYSFSSNTDITLDLLPVLRERHKAGERIAFVWQVNSAMPFMEGGAVFEPEAADFVLENPAYEFPLFAPPKQPVSLRTYAAAIHTAGLIKDGGTVQLGIGAFSDALTHALLLRQTKNKVFRDLAAALGAGRLHPGLPLETAPFVKGLYGATELFVEGYLYLYRAGVLKRRAFEDAKTQARADAGELRPEDYAKGALLHAAFFFGAQSFYDALNSLDEAERRSFQMTSISFVNQLYGDEPLKRAQRQHARFINSTMMMTLLGATVSDQLEDGRVVSGVGGQNNFVTQAHELEDGRSIIELPATRTSKGRTRSNILWSYGHTTIPRHLRDIAVTEYGAASLRGLSDRDTIAAMLSIADSRFQPGLLRRAKAAGKIEQQYYIPYEFRDNTPERIDALLSGVRKDGLLPQFPFGTDFTGEELALLPALSRLNSVQSSPLRLLRFIAAGRPWGASAQDESPLLARLGLDEPRSMKERIYGALVRGALRRA